jgi:hypothetical protein
MTSKLGDPDYCVVSHPDMDTRKQINQWYFRDGSGGMVSNEIPAGVCHSVLLDTYYCATPNQHLCHNLIAVTVLKEGGRPGHSTYRRATCAYTILDIRRTCIVFVLKLLSHLDNLFVRSTVVRTIDAILLGA